MNIGLIVFVIAVIILGAIILKKKQNGNKDKKDDKQDVEIIDEMEELFINEVKKGEKKCKLSNISDEFDIMYIKALFQEERIPYFLEEDKSLNIWPQRKVGTYGNISIYVLEKNYEDVIKIIKENRKGRMYL